MKKKLFIQTIINNYKKWIQKKMIKQIIKFYCLRVNKYIYHFKQMKMIPPK